MVLAQLLTLFFILIGVPFFHAPVEFADAVSLLNVSYDPTRELHQEFNAAFANHWHAKTAQTVTIQQHTADQVSRHGPSSTGCKRTS